MTKFQVYILKDDRPSLDFNGSENAIYNDFVEAADCALWYEKEVFKNDGVEDWDDRTRFVVGEVDDEI